MFYLEIQQQTQTPFRGSSQLIQLAFEVRTNFECFQEQQLWLCAPNM